jgi:hypothetical protein
MTKDNESQRNQILEELRSMKRLRRGQISEQLINKKGSDGEMHEYGPYFVWQAFVKGKKRSHRIPAEEVPQAREDMVAYKRFTELYDRLATLLEESACEPPSKKKPTRKHNVL